MHTYCLIILVWGSFLLALPICLSLVLQIIEPRKTEKHEGVKENGEAELSFFTESLGFVNDYKYKQFQTLWQTFLQNVLLEFKSGHESFDTKITKNYMINRKFPFRLCSSYLSDPIFVANNIVLHVSNERNTIGYVLKPLRLNYFSNGIEMVKAVRCPVMVNQQETQLYFQEVIINNWNGMSHQQRGYFVFTITVAIKTNSKIQPLELVMFTTKNMYQLPHIDLKGDEVRIQKSTGPPYPAFPINFNIGRLMSSDGKGTRLFGESAELIFLTKTYGFMDSSIVHWVMKELVLSLERMKRGYEVNSHKMEEERENNPDMLCPYYITGNYQLSMQGIFPPTQVQNTEVNWVSKSVGFPFSNILLNGQEREILQCSVTFGQYLEPGYIYLLPIHYKRKRKLSQLIIFLNYENDLAMVYPFRMSVFHEPLFGHNASKSDFEEVPDQAEIIETIQEWDPYGAGSSAPSLVNQ